MSETLTDAELDAIEARANAATEGPWQWDAGSTEGITPRHDRMSRDRFWAFDLVNEPRWIMTPHELVFDGFDEEEVGSTSSRLPVVVMEAADAAFIASARTDVPRLVSEIRRLRAASPGDVESSGE